MFFNLDTGVTSPKGSSGLLVWRDDENLWFGEGSSIHSIRLNDFQLKRFCSLLDRAYSSTEYVDQDHSNGLYLAMEAEDEGHRNLCLIATSMNMTYTVQVKHLKSFSEFLRNEIKL